MVLIWVELQIIFNLIIIITIIIDNHHNKITIIRIQFLYHIFYNLLQVLWIHYFIKFFNYKKQNDKKFLYYMFK